MENVLGSKYTVDILLFISQIDFIFLECLFSYVLQFLCMPESNRFLETAD